MDDSTLQCNIVQRIPSLLPRNGLFTSIYMIEDGMLAGLLNEQSLPPNIPYPWSGPAT